MNKFIIPDPNRGNWNAHSPAMKQYFGLQPNDPWPANGLPARVIAGIKVWVAPLSPNSADRRSRLHRVRAQCPLCNAVLSAGRLHQHVCKLSKSNAEWEV